MDNQLALNILNGLIGDHEPIMIPTLGGRSHILVNLNNNQIVITNARGRNFQVDGIWNSVSARMDDLDEPYRFMTNQYTDPIWQECPSRVFSPYVAALIRFLLDLQ